jgi:hypothetical protein
LGGGYDDREQVLILKTSYDQMATGALMCGCGW